jgi:hypothetical protein
MEILDYFQYCVGFKQNTLPYVAGNDMHPAINFKAIHVA